MLSRLLSRRRAAGPASASIPPGLRVYAVGDIHGRLDLLDDLLMRIEADERDRDTAETSVIFLGDLVDRGPDSAGVVERLRTLAEARGDVRFLMGNHEQIFLDALDGDAKAVRLFCRIGGRETLMSYGVTAQEYERLDYREIHERLEALVPAAHRAFLATFEDIIVIGDYAFVHAGIRPGTPLAEQSVLDMRWIRDPFLTHGGRLEKIVVHGHTIADTIERRTHRIGIDTGAYQSGLLTALGLEGDASWIIQT